MKPEKKQTIFQRLDNVLIGNTIPLELETKSQIPSNQILFTTKDKTDYERKLATYKQQKLLSYQWVKAKNDISIKETAGYTATRLMYRDADLMDECPEIGTALDIISEEVCTTKSNGKMLSVYSTSKRIQSILEDLFSNKLNINVWLPMIVRNMVKYGNDFHLLNINKDNGVIGWRELPVNEIDRIENGYGSTFATINNFNASDLKQDDVKFVWTGHNESTPYFNWQVAHFRLLNSSIFLPYGCSHLHKARRAWRMWSMMEDAMLIYRLDKSIERRVFKIYVGGIDDSDVEAYVNDIANNFKRLPVIDPQTGQVDLRKNFLDVSSDYFIPTRDLSAPSPIETLQGATYQTSMDDINYMQNKIFTALRVPKIFLNFQEAQGKGQSLSLVDVRFAKMINKIQKYVLMELQKIAQIHLFILGLEDDITNFTLSLVNATPQIKLFELDELTKKLSILQTALSDPGNGIPMYSLRKGLREIMDMTDDEIKEMLNEIRLEKAVAAELSATSNIIKNTGIFNKTDRIYGDFNAMNSDNNIPNNQNNDEMNMGNASPFGGTSFGGLEGGLDNMDFDLGQPGTENNGDLNGNESVGEMQNAPNIDSGNVMLKEHNITKSYISEYFDLLSKTNVPQKISINEKIQKINEKTHSILSEIDKILE